MSDVSALSLEAVADPRAENCRGYAVDGSGKVVGVELAVVAHPAVPYALLHVELIDEASAQGNCVATCRVLDREGVQIGVPVALAWPWPDLTEYAYPGNPNGQHPVTNGYTPAALGPLALVPYQGGQVVGDAVGGLGLPNNRHVSFVATWRERGAAGGDNPEPDAPPQDSEVELSLQHIEQMLDGLCRHLGVYGSGG